MPSSSSDIARAWLMTVYRTGLAGGLQIFEPKIVYCPPNSIPTNQALEMLLSDPIVEPYDAILRFEIFHPALQFLFLGGSHHFAFIVVPLWYAEQVEPVIPAKP